MSGRWLLLTGGGRGIGAVIARRAAEAGWSIALWDLDADRARAVVESLHAPTHVSQVDVTDEESVLAALKELPTTPHALVNNAGAVRFGRLLDVSVQDFEHAIRTNLIGSFIVGRTVARAMQRRGSGTIVNIASINGVAAAPRSGGYSSSKAGLIMLTQQMALEFAPFGLRVNAVAPGLIAAGMSEQIYADEEVRQLRSALVPLKRLGTADDVADALLFLISDAASYITGQTIVVDGGITAAILDGLPRPPEVDGRRE